ncbi:MAG: hypothetical protein DMG57_20620 [Acidobacteria bacterium]|nr:MAG: hypothetical protein DMG57_20620 [Acidobacteriota bacterium]
MDCRNWIVEVVESARAGLQPDAQLQKHLRECPRCTDRWDDEQRLSAELRTMRDAASSRSEVRREAIMREFELAHGTVMRRSVKLAFSIAAILLLTLALGQVWRNHRPADTIAQNPGSSAPGNEFEASVLTNVPEDDDFIAVPYAPPLAPGEFIRVVRTQLRPNALARMGIYVDASLSEMPADVVIGEDGFPRAVRVLGDIQF